tara:strand:- start:303 stop:797 length:495 start_codon:yes stop_codon:yes gene_type:complete
MKKIISLAIFSTLFLASCNTVRDSAGVNRKVIDEYSVIENPPLVIPPDFNLLPPDQMESKNIDDADTELAKEILFGLDDNENEMKEDNSLIKEIVKETQATEVDENIRDSINQDFAGEKSSINDETKFKSEDELNKAIQETANKDKNKKKKNKKEKKKKRFFFF